MASLLLCPVLDEILAAVRAWARGGKECYAEAFLKPTILCRRSPHLRPNGIPHDCTCSCAAIGTASPAPLE